MNKIKVIFFVLFIVSFLGVQWINYDQVQTRIDKLLEKELEKVAVTQELLFSMHQAFADSIYTYMLQTPKVMQTLSSSVGALDDERTHLRETMLTLLHEEYLVLKAQGVVHLQFISPDSRSFVRLHEPKVFDDLLPHIKQQCHIDRSIPTPAQGFDPSVQTYVYQYLYPMVNQAGEYLGVLEVAFNLSRFEMFLKSMKPFHAHFIVNKSFYKMYVEHQGDANAFIPSMEHPDFVYTKNDVDIETHKEIREHLFGQFLDEIDQKMALKKSFFLSIVHDSDVHTIMFLPQRDLRGINAWTVLYTDQHIVSEIIGVGWAISVISFFVLMALWFMFYRLFVTKEALEEEVKRQTKSLEKQKDSYEQLFEKAYDGVLIIENNHFVQCNEKVVQMLRYRSKEQLLLTHPSELSPKYQSDGRLSHEKAEEMMAFAIKNGGHQFEWMYKRSDGEQFWVEVVLTPISLDDKKIMYTVWRDISDRKMLEEQILSNMTQLKRQENYLQQAQKIAHIGVWENDVRGGNLYWSHEIYNIFGMDRRKFEPSYAHFLDRVHPDDRNALDMEYQASIKEKRDYYITHRIIKLDGTVHYVEERGAHQFDKEGNITSTVGVVLDVSDRVVLENRLRMLNENLDKRVKEEIEKNRQQEQQLLQQSRLAQMGEMISMIAHQWRQPLGAIATTSLNLKLKIELESFDLQTAGGIADQNRYFLEKLNDIEAFVQNLTTTIDDFRNFYKPNKEKVSITLTALLDKSLHIIKAALENDGIEVTQTYEDSESYELYDSEIVQVLLNVLKNAQDNFREKGTQNPQLHIHTKEAVIRICDNGGGIPPQIMEQIFDPYFSTKSEKNGTGLGLYMSKMIIDDHHHGKFYAQNENDGVCFIIDLNKRTKKDEK
jgi:PAS domain S-box-containing protein